MDSKFNTVVLDIETDSLDATKIHCIVASSVSGKQKVWIENECSQFADWSKQIDQFIMHNGVSFDAPILNSSSSYRRFHSSFIKRGIKNIVGYGR